MPFVLFLALALIWMPQLLPTKSGLDAHPVRAVSWVFVLGPPSLKSYGLLGLLALELVAFQTARTAFKQAGGATTGVLAGGTADSICGSSIFLA